MHAIKTLTLTQFFMLEQLLIIFNLFHSFTPLGSMHDNVYIHLNSIVPKT